MKKMLIDGLVKSREYQVLDQNESMRSIIQLSLSDEQLDLLPATQFVQLIDNQRKLVSILAGKEEAKNAVQPNMFYRQVEELEVDLNDEEEEIGFDQTRAE